jgi:WD40 repeat protein
MLAPTSQPEAKGILQAPSATWKQIHPNQHGSSSSTLLLERKDLLTRSPPPTRGDTVLSMDVSPGGELGVSGGSDSTVRIWHTKDGIMRVRSYIFIFIIIIIMKNTKQITKMK